MLLDDPRTGPPAQFVEVRIREVNHPNRTNEKGYFDAFLPPRLTPGKDITIEVKKEGYILQVPLDGLDTISENLDRRNKILLLKQGVPAVLTEERKDKILNDLQEKSRAQVTSGKGEKQVNLTVPLQEEARRLGLPVQDVERAVKQRGEKNRKSNDPHQLGLAATAENNPGKASEYFEKSAAQKVLELNRLRTDTPAKPFLQSQRTVQTIPHLIDQKGRSYEIEKLLSGIVKEFRLAGHAYYNSYAFEKALQAYQRASQFVSKDESPYQWAEVESDLGLANRAVGIRAEGPTIHQHLNAAVTAYRQALEVFTRKQLPQDWARTQMNLATALHEQGMLIGGEKGRRLLEEAVEALRQALKVYTRTEFPSDWANAQSNLAEAHFVTGQFGQAQTDIATVLTDTDLPVRYKIPLIGIEIGTLLGLKTPELIPAKLDVLRKIIANQPAGVTITWSFGATKRFISQDERFASYRGWLLDLLTAIESGKQKRILDAISNSEAALLAARKL